MKSPRDSTPATVDQSTESEITIQADGRVFAFGITQGLANVLCAMPMADSPVKRRLVHIRNLTAETNEPVCPDAPETK